MTPTHHRRWRTAAATGALALTLTACSGGSTDEEPSADPAAADDVAAALEEGGELLVWGWDPTFEAAVAAFEEAYPNVDVELANVGTGNDHYTALQNAVQAGSGVPDLAQVEYFAVPQFSIAESLLDVTPYGAADLENQFTPGPWGAVSQGGGIWGLPLDSGPMALFYNEAVFTEHGVDVPTTWDEYVEAGRALQEADPEVYVGADTGDGGFVTSMIWQAGGQPFAVDGTDVTVNLADDGSTQFAETWQTMIDEELLADIPGWTDEWFQAMDNGTLATLVTGAWMPTNLENGAPNAAGDWRVAPMPQWDEGGTATAENGGSSLAITEGGDNDKALAYGFLEFMTVGDGAQARIDDNAFPATTAHLEDPEFLAQESEYFGGQQINEVLAESAANVVPGWQYLPFQAYANSVFADTAGQAYTGSTTLTDGLAAWQEQIVTYGNDQGFTVTE